MIRSGKPIGFAALLSLVFCSIAFGTATPYQGIVDRNVFGLKPPPPPGPAVAEVPKTPLPPITLNGITTLLGTKRAFLSMQLPAKPPEPAKPQSFMLSEGQRDGDIEMIEIDEKGGTVKVNAFGTITNVAFPKLTASSPPPAGGAPGGATGIPAPPKNPFAPGGNPAFNRSIPSRTLRMPGMSQGAGLNNSQNPEGNSSAQSTPSINTPGGTMNLNEVANQNPQYKTASEPQSQGLTDDQLALMIEAQREATKQQVQNGTAAPLPTTRYTPPGAVGTDPGDASVPNQQTPVVNRRGVRGF